MYIACVFILAVIGELLVVGQVLEGTFTTLPVDWRSGQQQAVSLVSAPAVDFLNDTAVRFNWDLRTDNALARLATDFDIEISWERFSDDFQKYIRLPVTVPEGYSNNTYSSIYTAAGLQPESDYRFRVCPVFSSGRGHCSTPLAVTTLSNANNYWEAVLSRRLSLAASGRGYTNPVTQRPHLDTGVEVRKEDTSDNPIRFSDPVTSETPVLPSGRRGHTLSLIDQTVYMFGGRTNGYSCATIYKDTINIGNTDSGRDIYPCVHFQSEVSELWSFDLSTYQWVFLNTTALAASHPPPAREQHAATVIDRDLYIYGGKTRVFGKDAAGNDVLVAHSDVVFGDLWKLSVERAAQYVLQYTAAGTGTDIPQDGRLLAPIHGANDGVVSAQSDGVSNRQGLCIDKAIVRMKIYHPCINQVKVSLTGPGPQSGSPNYFPPSADQEVLLFSSLRTNGTGCVGGNHTFLFDDESSRRPDACCSQSYNGTYQPQGRLAEFVGTTMTADWTLVVQDLQADSIRGRLLSWEIEFTASPCVKTYSWTNLTSSGSVASRPVPRYGARVVSHLKSLFIYGGRDRNDAALTDLHRYDVIPGTWTTLTPVNFDAALSPASSVGANFALTSWGLLRFGGYYRYPTLPEDYGNYGSSIAVQDPVTLRWRELLKIDESPLPRDATFGRTAPSTRYLSAAVFIPSHTFHWQTKYTHHNLYDHVLPSSRSNYQASIADSLLIVGGFDGSTGSVRDGSSGGFLMDTWMLRLGNWSTPGERDRQQAYLERTCRWRGQVSGVGATASCMSATANAPCEWRDLMLLPWCNMQNQTVA